MKRISFFLVLFALCVAPMLHAEDAATEERLNKLSGQIEDLLAGQKAQREQIATLSKELEGIREQADKPNASYTSLAANCTSLAEAIKEVDRKRLEDYEKIRADLLKLGKTLATPPPTSKKIVTPATTDNAPPAAPEKGFEYVVKSGDTLSGIIAGCREKNIKITKDQLIKANPGLVPEKMRIGQKIFIPAPQG
jgi:LysM repeat protein